MSRNTTGWHWRRPARTCPWWCAGGHQCTAQHGYTSGEHRSAPMAWRTRYGRLVATRTEQASGGGWLDIHVSVSLAADQDAAHKQASRLTTDVDTAIRSALGSTVERIAA